MKKTASIYLMLFFLIFVPVLDISGHFINLAEFYSYFLFALGIKEIRPTKTVKIFIMYAILFFITVVFTSLLAGKNINNYDLFVLRNCAQLICLISVFYTYIQSIHEENTREDFNKFILGGFYILSLPAVLVFLQRVNILNAREWVQLLYKPQFFFLDADLFMEFRYTSVFKDFFTAGVYFIILSSGIYYFYLTAFLTRIQKTKTLLMIVIIYLAQLFVSRSSLVLIPFNLVLMTLFASRETVLASLKRLVVLLLVLVPFFVILINVLIESNYVRGDWVSEGLNMVMNHQESSSSSSFLVMQEWNQNFFEHIAKNPQMLFVPNHEYDLKESSAGSLYTDGFYPQEIYRYGIYGILAYAYLVFFLIRCFFRTNPGLMIVVLSFVLLNYKGGNVFFMPKNIYLYAFIISSFLVLDSADKKERQSS